MDLPSQFQGASAVIYKGEFGGNKGALKLFTSIKLGEMKRYDSLSTYFDSKKIFSNCNYFTNFKYVPRAIEIKLTTPENEGKTDLFPIIKMDWIEGKILEEFIKETDDQDKIKKLSENFLKMVNTLEDLKIAHGDLHPKNILVDDELNLILVDYDCIYIDEFKGTKQPELGDPDCQHPNRKHFEYNTKIDYFSNLVIYLALVAISEDLKLKSHKSTGDFIFSKKDFVDPSKSELFQKLENMGNKVSILCKELKKYCKSDRPQMRSLKVILMAEKDKDMEEN